MRQSRLNGDVYGTLYTLTFVGIAGAALFVISLLFLASPLLAVVLALLAGIGLFLVMSLMRQRTREEADRPAAEREGPPTTPAGRTTGPIGKRPSGEPASGEG